MNRVNILSVSKYLVTVMQKNKQLYGFFSKSHLYLLIDSIKSIIIHLISNNLTYIIALYSNKTTYHRNTHRTLYKSSRKKKTLKRFPFSVFGLKLSATSAMSLMPSLRGQL